MSILEVKNLKTYFFLDKEEYPAVDSIEFSLEQGETIGIIGESGSGKSVTALSIMGLVDSPGEIIDGEILYKGEDLLKKKEREMRAIRGNDISMIYQDPMSTLNPMIKVGKQIEEAILIHNKMDKNSAKKKTLELLKAVGISGEKERYDQLPEQFSGGMRQRIMIAMGIANNPSILIADEPTTALDVTIQAEILELLKELREKYNMSIIMNTHDLAVVGEMADKVIVMYCGKIMERGTVQDVFKNPLNPYTEKLMDCIPRMNSRKNRLDTIKGYVPHPTEYGDGCRFFSRCHKAMEKCKNNLPELLEIEDGHFSRCWLNID